MVVFDAKLDYVLKDLLGVPIDTETNPTRLAFEEEAIHSWSKFLKLPTSFIDGLRFLKTISQNTLQKVLSWNSNPFETTDITLYKQMMSMQIIQKAGIHCCT